jgi:lysophospholipase L1-like esterase
MKKLFYLVFIFIFSCSPLKKYNSTSQKWEVDIAKLENLDNNEKYSENALLFIGSSSIRRWISIKKDMAPYETIKRGYGGAHYSDIIHFSKRLVKNHKPKAILIFVANDIKGNNKNDLYSKNLSDRNPFEVKRLFKFTVSEIRSIHKEIPIIAIETTPTPSRWSAWDKISKANDLIKNFCRSKSNLHFIQTRGEFIGTNGLPIENYFVKDMLHLNETGYLLWSRIIKANLKTIL